MNKGFKGRKKGSSNTTYIHDELMEPYYISCDQNGFTVKEGDEDNYQILGYFSGFDGALKKIMKEKLNVSKKTYTSLEEYITEWNNINEQFRTLTNI